jgi:hypothetical protein
VLNHTAMVPLAFLMSGKLGPAAAGLKQNRLLWLARLGPLIVMCNCAFLSHLELCSCSWSWKFALHHFFSLDTKNEKDFADEAVVPCK